MAAPQTAPSAEFQAGGKPVARPAYLVDVNGNPITSSNPLDVKVDVSIAPTANQRVNAQSGDFVAGAVTDLATLLTLAGTPADANTVASLMGRLTKIRDLLSATLTVQGAMTEANSAAILADLAILAGVVSSNKAAVKAGAGDFADLASILTALQGILAIKRSAVAVYSLASIATSGTTQNSGDLTVGPYTEISIDINTTAQTGTNPTIQYFYERKGADGIYYVLWQSSVLTAAANTLSTSIGAGMAYTQSVGATGRLRWVIGGTATPTFTHTVNMQGK